MPDNTNDDTSGSEQESSQSSTEAAGADEQDPNKVIEDLRKRQSGADKARDAAIAERDRLAAELRALQAGEKPAQPKDKDGNVDIEAVKRELRAEYEQNLAKEKAATEAKFLDAQFPEARKRFPEVTDPAKLVELENYYGEAPKPVGNNAPRSAGAKSIDDMSIKELRDSLDQQLPGVLGRS